MSFHGSFLPPCLRDGVDGYFLKNGVNELTSGVASEVPRSYQLGRIEGNRGAKDTVMGLPFLRLHHRLQE